MFAVLPIIALIVFWLIFWNRDPDWRSALLSAAVVWGILITAFTEILSLVKFLTFGTVLAAWGLTIVISGFIYYRLIREGKREFKGLKIFQLTPVPAILLGSIVFIVAVVGLISIVSPPNNWDSMTYHMPRVVHWIQNHSVAHYPTYDSAQLVHPPFAEFAIMHLQILSDGDRLANLVQWLAMAGSIIGVSLIAKQLDADRYGQILAAVFCTTIPMGILQASSTQNDYVVAFWLVCLAHYVLSTLPYKKPPTFLVFAIGACLGLAILTKSSGYIFAFPFMVWLFCWYVNRLRWRLWQPFCIVTGTFLLLNLGHYLRNVDLYGSPIATVDYTDDYKIEVYSLQTWISNIIRNLSLHVDIVRYLHLQSFITPITGKVEKIISIIHGFLGVDINDPRTTFPANSYRVPGLSFDENVAGNPLHFFLLLTSLIGFWLKGELRKNKKVISYLLTLIGGFLLLCFMLKIQPYHSRHHLTLFVLFSAFVGLVFSKIANRYIVTALAVILIVTSLPFVFENKFRPIAAEKNIFNTPRSELYFTNRPYIAASYLGAIDFLKTTNCTNIGFSLGGEAIPSHLDWEYPFWALLQENKEQNLRFQHILHPDNTSSRFLQESPYKDFTACAIIATRSSKQEPVKQVVVNGTTYITKWSSEPTSILMKQ
ncbi:MAG: 4-amino-4-deoxy-L-arabinose transferase [Hydrococcus sp. C42_A2020_068]|nr:4-amino-4-deoxy-L-arabinose transferase [Hydrococcus sp. C42_A2020_068]